MSLLRPRKTREGRDDSVYRGSTPGFAAECHPDRREIRDGHCKECLALERLQKSGQKLLAKTALEQTAVAEVMAHDMEYLQDLATEAKRILQERLPDYARLHYDGAMVAAANGDTKPSEWALERVDAAVPKAGAGAIAPKKDGDGPGGGVRIMIGVNLGGGTSTATPNIAIEGETIDLQDASLPL